MATFDRGSLRLHFHEVGHGIPFIFQHGLGGDLSQPFGIFRPPRGIRLIAFDCRGHGQSPLGPEAEIHLETYVEDLLGLLDSLEIAEAIAGGISMGAAIALGFALRHPERVRGLVLSRPAWLETAHAFNRGIFPRISQLIRQFGCVEGRRIFIESEVYRGLRATVPETARSLEGQFLNPRCMETAVALDQIPNDAGPGDRGLWRQIHVPTLILANRNDPIHPFDMGETLAANIPGGQLRELTSKSIDATRHQQQVQAFIEEFLELHFPFQSQSP